MNKIKKAVAAFFCAVIIMEFFAMPVMASSMVNDGLEITIETDKESYEEGEAITATITVKNVKDEPVIIRNIEQVLPEGYKFTDESEIPEGEIILEKGDSVSVKVTYEGEDTSAEENKVEAFFNNVIYGESFGIPNILIALILIIAAALFFYFT